MKLQLDTDQLLPLIGAGVSLGGLIIAASFVIPKLLIKRKLSRFSADKCPKNVVILHGTRRTAGIPAASPFVLKLETFIRMANIPYKYDGNLSNSLGPKQKTPWLSLNGEHVADSQICIEFLQKKFDNPIHNSYSDKELAIARMVRISLEDKIYWELLLWAFVWPGDGQIAVQKFLKFPYLLVKYFNRHYTKLAWAHGIGRHDQDIVKSWLLKDVSAVAEILGDNKFLLGDDPCVEDACVFGCLSQLMWGYQSMSNHAAVIKERHQNIVDYCNRMKQLYYPDWDQLLAQ